jgi:hypothetical protein
MSEYADNVSGASAGRFQYFISESPWEYRQISAQTQYDIADILSDSNSVKFEIAPRIQIEGFNE